MYLVFIFYLCIYYVTVICYYFWNDIRARQTNKVLTQRQQDNIKKTGTLGEDFWSLLNSIRRGKSDVTIETIRAIKEELNTHMSWKLDESRMELDSQIVETMNSAIMARISPELQCSNRELGEGLRTKMDIQSAGRDRKTGGTRIDKMASKWPKSSKETDNLIGNIRNGLTVSQT